MRRGHVRNPDWTRISPAGDKLTALWVHAASGWRVRHCGHPTANWPYYAVDPEDPHRCTMTHNGLGFRTLNDAFEQIEAVLAGRAVATNDRCGPRTRRIVVRS